MAIAFSMLEAHAEKKKRSQRGDDERKKKENKKQEVLTNSVFCSFNKAFNFFKLCSSSSISSSCMSVGNKKSIHSVSFNIASPSRSSALRKKGGKGEKKQKSENSIRTKYRQPRQYYTKKILKTQMYDEQNTLSFSKTYLYQELSRLPMSKHQHAIEGDKYC